MQGSTFQLFFKVTIREDHAWDDHLPSGDSSIVTCFVFAKISAMT